jgi:hypothetical protein
MTNLVLVTKLYCRVNLEDLSKYSSKLKKNKLLSITIRSKICKDSPLTTENSFSKFLLLNSKNLNPEINERGQSGKKNALSTVSKVKEIEIRSTVDKGHLSGAVIGFDIEEKTIDLMSLDSAKLTKHSSLFNILKVFLGKFCTSLPFYHVVVDLVNQEFSLQDLSNFDYLKKSSPLTQYYKVFERKCLVTSSTITSEFCQ